MFNISFNYMQEKLEIFIHTLGEIIKEHRISSGKSIYKISAESAIPKSTWRRIEQGCHKDICLTSLWKISDGLEMQPELLIKELREKLGNNFSLSEDD